MRTTASAELRRLALEDPDRVAMVSSGGSLRYADLDAAVEAHAAWLVHRQAQGDVSDVVALRFLGTHPAIVSSLAISRAGLACAVIDPLAPAERVTTVLADLAGSGAPPLFVTDNPADLELHATSTLYADIAAPADAPLVPAELERGPDELQNVIFTSGSTGIPVGLEVDGTQRAAIDAWARGFISFTESARVGCIAAGTLGQSAEFPRIVVAAGATMHVHDVLMDGLDGIPRWLRDQRIEAVPLVPTLIRVLMPLLEAELGDTVLPDLRTVTMWGESADWDDLAQLSRFLPPDAVVHNAYATTETGMIAALSVPRDEVGAPGERPGALPAGRPLDSVTVRILTEDGQDAPLGTAGEITVASPHLARRHWGRPDLTAGDTLTLDGRRFWRTGDGGRFDDDGVLHVLGRLDDVVKIAGHRVSLGELERAARAQTGIDAAAATAREDSSGALRLHLFVVPGGVGDADVRWVRAALARTLPPAALPDTVTALPALPTLANGKTDRAGLPEPAPGTPTRSASSERLVDRLRVLFASVLESGDVGADDDFFDLGGDSLRAVRLAGDLQRELGRPVPASLIMEAPTPSALAAALTDAAHPLLVPVRAVGDGVPLFVVHGGAGEVLFARRLLPHLDADQPVYALQPPPLTGPTPFAPTLLDVAARYVEEIRRIWPHGPYRLFGYSLGGVIAFEMAVLLQDAGAEVSLLALGDSWPPETLDELFQNGIDRMTQAERDRPLVDRFKQGVAHRSSQIARRLQGAPLRTAQWRRFMAGGAPEADIVVDAYRRVYGELTYQHSISRTFDGDVRLIVALRGDGQPDRGWTAHVGGRLERVEVDCEHEDLVHEPAVAELARALRVAPAVDAVPSSRR